MIFVGLGANLPGFYGEPYEALKAAVDCMRSHASIQVVSLSPIYVSAPVPVSDQPWYYNAVVSIETDLDVFALWEVLQEIESDFGRVRGEPNAPRVLDLDILAYHDEVIDEKLVVPHPRMAERAFVLLPLFDIAPDWAHPVSGLCVADLKSMLSADQHIERFDDRNSNAG